MINRTKVKVKEYIEFEKSLLKSGETLNINQIYDPENIKELLCNDPDRKRCLIRFSPQKRLLYGCTLTEENTLEYGLSMCLNK